MSVEQANAKKIVWFDTARRIYGTMIPDILWAAKEGRWGDLIVNSIATATLGTITVLIGDTVLTLENMIEIGTRGFNKIGQAVRGRRRN